MTHHKIRHGTLTKEGENSEPTGILTDRYPQTPLGGGFKDGEVEKQYSGTEHDNLLVSDLGPQSQGGQSLSFNPNLGEQYPGPSLKPTEETATIGDDNLGAGSEPMDSTYPYPPNPDPSLGVSENSVLMPKLQVGGPPQDSYGVRNTMSNSSNFGAVADNQMQDVVQRVTNAIMAEIGQSDPTGLGEESGPMPFDPTNAGAPIRQDGNEVVVPDGTVIQPNGQSGFDARTQIPRQTKAEEVADDFHFPYIIAFDWNGTIDARNTGRGIPIQVLQDLQSKGKKVLVFTSSTQGADKDFMRQTLDQLSIPYTDDERVLTDVDMLIGDKKSDEKRAGRYGVKFIDVNEFSVDKVLAKSASIPGMDRTAVGDKWQPGYDVMQNREGGVPVMLANVPAHSDMVIQQLQSRGFVLNELGQMGDGSHRLEHKMGNSIAKVQPNGDRLEVTVTDRIGRPVLLTSQFDKLDAFLNENFPSQDD